MSMPVAGPGALSQRTDTQAITTPTGLPYGEAGQLRSAQQAAPLPATPTPNVVDLGAPTQRPNEPVTHGADFGPGADSSILRQPGPPATGGALSQLIARAAAADTSGVLQQLLIQAQQRGL
jgi:hypothetical protein